MSSPHLDRSILSSVSWVAAEVFMSQLFQQHTYSEERASSCYELFFLLFAPYRCLEAISPPVAQQGAVSTSDHWLIRCYLLSIIAAMRAVSDYLSLFFLLQQADSVISMCIPQHPLPFAENVLNGAPDGSLGPVWTFNSQDIGSWPIFL